MSESELRRLIALSHKEDHRKGTTIFQDLRHFYYPVNRMYVIHATQEFIKDCCPQCRAVETQDKPCLVIPKSVIATYPNSRWQLDLKKMPAYRGYTRVLNIVMCTQDMHLAQHLKQSR